MSALVRIRGCEFRFDKDRWTCAEMPFVAHAMTLDWEANRPPYTPNVSYSAAKRAQDRFHAEIIHYEPTGPRDNPNALY